MCGLIFFSPYSELSLHGTRLRVPMNNKRVSIVNFDNGDWKLVWRTRLCIVWDATEPFCRDWYPSPSYACNTKAINRAVSNY